MVVEPRTIKVVDNGPILRESFNPETKEVEHRNLREDPVEAIRSSLAHSISVFERITGNITPGKIGNTETTFNPDAGTGNTTVDGATHRLPDPREVWEVIIDGAGTASDDTDNDIRHYIEDCTTGFADCDSGEFARMFRTIMTFDTSSIGSDTVDSAVLSLFGTQEFDTNGNNPEANIYDGNPASNNAIVNGDYNTDYGTTTPFSTAKNEAAWATSAFNDFTLNTDGENNIDTSSISGFSALESKHDAANIQPATWGSGGLTGMQSSAADDTAGDPKLVVQHSAAAADEENLNNQSWIVGYSTDWVNKIKEVKLV